MKMFKITHLTSVHPRYDTRIFMKECCSLAKIKEYHVSLIVADSLGDEEKNGVYIYDVNKSEGRINRILKTTQRVFEKAKELDSDIYHFHDPELISVGIRLKKMGKKVIFDIHENIYFQIKNKSHIPKSLRGILSFMYGAYEGISLNKFDRLILAENSYKEYFSKFTIPQEVILNFPSLAPLEKFKSTSRKGNDLFYIGGVSHDRGLKTIVSAFNTLKKRYKNLFLHYIGPIYNTSILESISYKEDEIKFYGAVPLYEALEFSKEARVGLAILKPIANYQYSFSTKIFEYMAIGLPVITSNFPLYQDIIQRYDCGICIDPNNQEELEAAISYIFENQSRAKEMGENGIKASQEVFNWTHEEVKLFKLYKELLV